MCGIIGQMAFGKFNEEQEKVRQESMIFLGSELIQMTQVRGKDATGTSVMFEDGNYYGLKMGIPAIEFLSRYGKNDKEYGGFVKVWRKSKKIGRVFLGHCRATTRGCSLDNANNHPIESGEIIGVHNGTIQNDDDIFDRLGCERSGAVDSEAIFRLLQHYTDNGTEPFTTKIMEETVKKLAGTFAVLAYSGNNPFQACAFRDRKPFEMLLIKPLKLLICASDKQFMETAVYRYNKHINLYITTAKFPTLKSADLEYKTLRDDSAVVFDLRTEITKDTEIDELYNWEKMPRIREWGHGTGNHYQDPPGNRQYGLAAQENDNAAGFKHIKGAKPKTVSNPTILAPKPEVKREGARIWMASIKKFVQEDSVEAKEMKKIGNVEIDIVSGNKNEIDLPESAEGPNAKFTLETVGANTIEKDADIINVPTIKELERPKKDDTDNTHEMTAVEIDTSVDTEAIEASEEMTKRLEQYETLDEVVTDLEIKDAETLQQIPIVALANRIQKFVLKRGVYKGYLYRKNEEKSASDHITLHKKKEAAETNVRTMKVVTRMLLRIIRLSGYVKDHALDKVVAETLENKEDISSKNMDKLFTSGDSREFDIIRRMKESVAGKENR